MSVFQHCKCGEYAIGTAHTISSITSYDGKVHTRETCGLPVPTVLNPPADPLPTFDEWLAELSVLADRLMNAGDDHGRARERGTGPTVTAAFRGCQSARYALLAHARRRIRP